MAERPCCAEDHGGSHYHCSNCGRTSSQYGHYGKRVNGVGDPNGPLGFQCPGEPVCTCDTALDWCIVHNIENWQVV